MTLKALSFNVLLCVVLSPGAAVRAQVVGGYPMPSLDDERNTYTAMGKTWPASAEPNFPGDGSYTVNNPDIHGDTEADDLWNYLMAYRRTGEQGYLDRAQAWATYFKNDYRSCNGSSYSSYCYDKDAFGLDHLWGWGLVAWYEHSGDTAALAAAEDLMSDVEAYWSDRSANGYPTPGQFRMAYYSLRQGARHLLLATRVAHVTQNQRWIDLRDRLIELWLQSPDWDSRGMYFDGDYATDLTLGEGAWDTGDRIQSPFQIGVLAEAFHQAYRVTGREELKDRMVQMARFADGYGLDATYQYASSMIGIVNGQPWQKYNDGGPVNFWDPVYTTALVNILVLGYKFTGDQSLLDQARHCFDRGNKGLYGEPVQRAAPDGEIHHFVDTVLGSSTADFYLEYNKGELQYTYLLFENGGSPTVETEGYTPPPPPPPPPAPDADTVAPAAPSNVSVR